MSRDQLVIGIVVLLLVGSFLYLLWPGMPRRPRPR
jgi:hypothetical protein